jgi:hypothetical protein
MMLPAPVQISVDFPAIFFAVNASTGEGIDEIIAGGVRVNTRAMGLRWGVIVRYHCYVLVK